MKIASPRTRDIIPSFGLGTWRMGEAASQRTREVAAVRHAIELGYRLIDTAEMYGEGGAEEVIGMALRGLAERPFIVSKVYPQNATAKGVLAACERSRTRLGVDCIDLYLLHWRGGVPLAETVEAFEKLCAAGRIRQWGVSNFDVDDLRELLAAGGVNCAANQIYYSASQRGPEVALLPWLRERQIPAMAYSPVDQGALANDATFARIGARYGASAVQAALAWALAQPSMVVIPKAVRHAHLEENYRAQAITLNPDDVAAIEQAFPRPTSKRALAML